MKKILYLSLMAVLAMVMTMSVSSCCSNDDFEGPVTPATTGEAEVLSTAGISGNKVQWVQLWADGPKFATINVGQTVKDYSSITTETYSLANVGGLYTWGGTVNSNGGTYSDDHNTGTADLTGDTDTATKLWGSAWRMPTQEELTNLGAGVTISSGTGTGTYCKWTWCSGASGSQYVEGCTLAGFKIEGLGDYASNSVFFPAAGFNIGSVYNQGNGGDYWSSTPKDASNAYGLYFYSSYQGVGGSGGGRGDGQSVRAVLK